ncbi:MAG TPA: hypothetical protein PLV92_03640 [Pirellulaceae bacterium]|nr:hypothetical protein [Pirellulaceae bacterium]
MYSTLLVASLLLCGQTEPKDPAADAASLKATVTRLVRQLDDNQLSRREAAEKELAALGPAALAVLPPVTRQTPAEVKDRLARVRRTLESAAAEAATRPVKINLQGEMKLNEALSALEKQSGNKLIDFRRRFNQQARNETVKVDFKDLIFWDAFDQLLDQAELTTYAFSGEKGVLAVVARGQDDVARKGAAAYSGLFRFEGTRIEATRDLRNPMNQGLKLTVDLSWEPRLQPIVINQPLDQLTIADDEGRAMAIDGREGEIEVTTDGETSSAELVVPIRLPDRSVKKIGSLKGTLQVVAPGRFETFEFTDLEKTKNVEHRRAAVNVAVDQVRKNQDVYEVRMRVKFDAAANSLESHRNWIYSNPAQIVDAEGQPIENAGMEATLQEADEVGIAYQFVLPNGLKGCKFVYTTPVAIIKMPVEYELKNIELP